MDNRVKLVKQPDGTWTTNVDNVDRIVALDETPLIVWRTLGLHPGGVVEVHQLSNGTIERFSLLSTGEELTELEFTRQHTLFRSLNIRQPYLSGA